MSAAVCESGAVMLAEAEALNDADSIAEWLGGNCFQKRGFTGYVPTRREGSELSDKFYCWLTDHAKPHELLTVAMNHRAWADVAMARMADMYVQDEQAWIAARAKEMEA
jgi:hypothetical protein